MMHLSNAIDHCIDVMEKPGKDEGSTTEEEESNSVGDTGTSEGSEVFGDSDLGSLDFQEQWATMMDQKQEALRLYGERFGIDRTGTKISGMRPQWKRNVFEFDTSSKTKPLDKVLADMDHDLKVQARVEQERDASLHGQEAALKSDAETAFGYAGSLEDKPPFAKFDIRDSICMKVGGFKHGQVVRDRNGAELVVVGVRAADGAKRLWFQPKSLGRPGAGAFQGSSQASLKTRLTLVPGSHVTLREMTRDDFDEGDYSDGEEVSLCRHCRLPLGHHCYKEDGSTSGLVHAECLAQSLSNKIKDKELLRKREESDMKKKVRAEYSIGWRAKEVPRNMNAALQLGCPSPPQGMCGLVYDQDAHMVHVTPTLEPAESVNLEYLSLALQVRMKEGKEPLFSLDPVDPTAEWEKGSMQEKRYEPEWLAGTSVGEVLFQADYHLKELSLGEYDQPIVGMKSCDDYCTEHHDDKWDGREWFVVKKAEVQMTEANILVPRVKMGVEARELVLTEHGLLDKSVTCPNHPLVRYAEQFTHYFDLIAERKSAIYHLRDLAKASVLAKMLVETDVSLHESWFSLGEAREVDSLEVPQLWNMRVFNHIEVNNSKIVTDADKNGSRGMYGGVNFGLSAQSISIPSAVAKAPIMATSMATGRLLGAKPTSISAMPSAAMSVAAAVTRPAMAPITVRKPGLGLISVTEPPKGMIEGRVTGLTHVRDLLVKPHLRSPIMPGSLPIKPSMPLSSRPPMQTTLHRMIPQGVDLNLDEFNVSEVTRTAGHDWSAAGDVKSATVGDMFWSAIDSESNTPFQSKDKDLLKAVFHPSLSDRRDEGEHFVPPETSFDYVQRLRSLVQEEEAMSRKRQEHFLSSSFSISNPGHLFPHSWKPSVGISNGKGTQWHVRSDYMQQSHKLEHLVKSTAPTFHKTSEDDVHFRIYHFGNLEVRTTQTQFCQEVIGAVYSKSAPIQEGKRISQHEKVKTVTEYVEKVGNSRRSYVVLETEEGNMVVSEKFLDGTLAWEENPTDLEDRSSLAKVIRSASCSKDEVTVGHMKEYQKRYTERYNWESVRFGARSVRAECKCYAQAFYVEAAGDSTCMRSGFAQPRPGDLKWRISESEFGLYSPSSGEASREENRKRVGDKVQVKATGRVGEITFDDGSALPYKVAFADGDWPLSKWYKECDLHPLDDVLKP